MKDELALAASQYFVSEAPIALVCCADTEKSASQYGERGRNLYCIQDAAAATENVLLCATALGLGACWVGAFREDRVSNLLNLPKNIRPLAIIPVGYPKQ